MRCGSILLKTEFFYCSLYLKTELPDGRRTGYVLLSLIKNGNSGLGAAKDGGVLN
jgi:hypothetical protein